VEASSRSTLLYEPRTEGHHLVWLRFITEDLLGAGWRLSLAVDTRPEQFARVRQRLGPLLDRVEVLPAYDGRGRKIGGDGVRAVSECLVRAGTGRVFLDTLDEIASPTLRRAAIGCMPPASLLGRMGGIYVRPRFLARRGFSFNEWLKDFGFRRLMRGGWFNQLLFLDPWIQHRCKTLFPQVPSFFLPDPCPDDFAGNAAEGRRRFEIPVGRKVLLFYGAAYRRKGLHLAVEALRTLPPETKFFLLCAGQQARDAQTLLGLETLVSEGRARVLSRYIFEEEEKALFAASDIVLLPYIKHFGNSAVLSRAAGARRMVIASDDGLVGRLVAAYGLGLLFKSGNVVALRETVVHALTASSSQYAQWQEGAERYAGVCTRAEFRKTLLASFG
jgi:glycosyltransferase involved in cell wall biosynthesis